MVVTDPKGRVLGVLNLRVRDASLMATVPRAYLNIPALIMAGKIAHTVWEAQRVE